MVRKVGGTIILRLGKYHQTIKAQHVYCEKNKASMDSILCISIIEEHVPIT